MPIIIPDASYIFQTDILNIGEGLIGVDDVKNECPDSGLTDDEIKLKILKWQQMVERYTCQWFDKREVTARFEGNDTRMLFMQLPIVSIEYVKINLDTSNVGTELATTSYRVFDSRVMPDDRRNPRIELTGLRSSIFSGSGRHSVFKKGLWQEVKGVFGFLEPDDKAPEIVRCALLKLVCSDIIAGRNGDPTGPSGEVSRIKTDLHEIEYLEADMAPVQYHLFSQEIKNMLDMYRGPVRMASPVTIC